MTGFSHFTMVNVRLVCGIGNGGRIKAKFTIVNRPESRSFIKVYLNFVFFADNLSVFLISKSSIAPALRTCFLPGPQICRELFSYHRTDMSDNYSFT